MAVTARDIPMTTKFGRESLAAVGTNFLASQKAYPLPTPPNSISTSLPPCSRGSYESPSTTTQLALGPFESRLDHHTPPNNLPKADTCHIKIQTPDYDSIGDITPALLAQYHLPGILLNHGPLAIRHIMGLLTIAVPGFSRLSPTKARRLVVSALEGRPNGEDNGGLKTNVKFEKVGWGRWEAKLQNHPNSRVHVNPETKPSGVSSLSANNLIIANTGDWKIDRSRLNTPDSSWTNEATLFLHGDDIDINIHGVTMVSSGTDKMSIDGDEICSSLESEDEKITSDDSADMTDDEDWAALGAAALRAASYSTSGPRSNFLSSMTNARKSSSCGQQPLSILAQSDRKPSLPGVDVSSFYMNSNSPEREAIEALLRLGSV